MFLGTLSGQTKTLWEFYIVMVFPTVPLSGLVMGLGNVVGLGTRTEWDVQYSESQLLVSSEVALSTGHWSTGAAP